MLNVIEYGKEGYDFPALIVLGCFDAIHVGHRELLKKAKLQAKINGLDLGVMIFKEGKSGKLVSSFEERLAVLEQFNVKFVVAIDYNEEFKSIPAIDFLHALEDRINVKAYMSGKDFRFGAQAKGKSSTLKNYAEDEENGVWYMPVKDVVLNGEKVSTTLIKSCLEAGNVAKANELLGAEFSLTGEVVHGEGRGASVVGFPTVNIEYPDWKYPLKHGVYSVKCLVDDTDYQGIANFGTCPTFNDSRVALEVYLEGFSGDLYGKTLTVRFVDYIRDIEEFASAEALSEQLNVDLQSTNEELAVTEAAEEVVEIAEEAPVIEDKPAEKVAEEAVIEEAPVTETIEEVVEEVVDEQPAEEVVEVVEEQPAEEVTEVAPIEEVEEQPFEEEENDGFDELVEEPVEETVEELVVEEAPAEEVAEEPVVEETTVTETVDELVEEQPVEEVVEVIDEQPSEETTEEIAEEIPEQPAEEIIEEIAAEPAETDEVTEEVSSEEVGEDTATDIEEDKSADIETEVIEDKAEDNEQPADDADDAEQNKTEDGE